LKVQIFGTGKVSKTLPLPDGCEYQEVPTQTKIREIYASCDAWLFTSRGEGFGLPILESMACRTPVIGFPSGAAPEFLSDNRGILVKQDDPIDLAKAIVSICNMPDSAWRTMSTLAYEKVNSYRWEDATDLFESALFDAIKKSAAI
jgi:glycosyltransferase involved in cell wall biosynthesis